MPDTATPLPPAGWYVDNQDALIYRWWDGTQWTEHTHRVGPEPVAAADRALPRW